MMISYAEVTAPQQEQPQGEIDLSPWEKTIKTVIKMFDPDKGHKALLIMDIDQTVLDSLGEHFFGGQMLLLDEIDEQLKMTTDKDEKAELEERRKVIEAMEFKDLGDEGGAFVALGDIPGYKPINNFLIKDVGFHEDMVLMDETIPKQLDLLSRSGIVPALYLSARPNEVKGVTRKILKNFICLFDAKLITRDFNTMKWKESNAWKAQIIKEIASGVKAKGGKVIMMDDNLALIKMLEQVNADLGGDCVLPLLMDSWTRTAERDLKRPVKWSKKNPDDPNERTVLEAIKEFLRLNEVNP